MEKASRKDSPKPLQISILNKDGQVEMTVIPGHIVQAAQALPYDPSRYFLETPASRPRKVALLIQSRARPLGIENAVNLMAAAYHGEQPKREPIRVRKLRGGKFLVLDGNSTATVAKAASWPDIPCILVSD